MLKKFKMWSGALALIIFAASCTSTVHIEKDDNANFSEYKTFAWIDKDGEGKADKNRSNDLTEEKIRTAISHELEKTAGWREVRNRPDILLSYDVLVEKSVKDVNDPVYSQPFTRLVYNPYTRRYARIYYPSQFMGYDSYQREVREGTVSITMIDARTDKAVWQGWTTDEVNGRRLSSKEIQGYVKSIFKKFDLAKN